jgi:very-short-patch-repair endonuclease
MECYDNPVTGIRTCLHECRTLFIAKDICNELGLRNTRNATKTLPTSESINLLLRTKGGIRKMTCLTLSGLKCILLSTRKTKALTLAKALGIELLDVKVVSIETSTMYQIQDAFQNESVTSEYHVDGFRIDLYFPKYRIAVECDEEFHDRQIDKDVAREQHITEMLDCTFIRYRPNENGFSIFHVIRDIHDAIVKCVRSASHDA